MNEKIRKIITSGPEKLEAYIEQQMERINELQEELDSQVQLNKSLIETVVDENKRKNRIYTETGFVIQKWNMINYRKEKNAGIPCYKLKIKTPYSALTFNISDVILMWEEDREKLEEQLGKINYIEDIRKVKEMIFNEPGMNWYWGTEYEGDLEHDNCIVMYVYCSRRPVLHL